MTPSSIHSMIHQLRSRGFACHSLSKNQPWILNALQAATQNDAAKMNQFRFPPLEGPIHYDDSKRLAFRALLEVATTCFEGLLVASSSSSSVQDKRQESSLAHENRKRYMGILRQYKERSSSHLFQKNPNEPFFDNTIRNPPQPFSSSFFNLFNYNHGSLNAHKDRSLLTVIYSHVPTMIPSPINSAANSTNTKHDNNYSEVRRSALWIKDSNNQWHNADQIIQSDQIVVMVGEDFETSGISSSLGLYAAEHAVRVNPEGPFIEKSHFRKDPDCRSDGGGERCSAALILRHELD